MSLAAAAAAQTGSLGGGGDVAGPPSAISTPSTAPKSGKPSAKAATAGKVSPAQTRVEVPDVVVSANKRNQNLRKVPTSIGVISGKELQEHAIQDYEDISRTLPGISFAAHNGAGQDDISIRGISSTVGNPTVGIYIDEVPIITQNGYEGQAQPRFLDLARVEVLRGPQGTLYGASSEGGTIRFITNQPDLDTYSAAFSSDLSGTLHGGANADQQVIVNVPVIKDVFALRLAGELLDESGWINNNNKLAGVVPKANTNYDRTGDVRISGKLQASSDLVITPSYYYQNIYQGDSPNFFENDGLYVQNKQVRETLRDTISLPSLTIDQKLGFGHATSVTSYLQRDIDRQADGTDFNSTAIADFFLDPTYPQFTNQNSNILGNSPSPVLFTDRFKTWTQELRLASNVDQRLRWVFGFFFSDQLWSHLDYETIPGFSNEFQQIYGFDINDSVLGQPGNPSLWNNDLVYTVYDHNEITQYAGFGQVEFDILPTLHFSFGDRYVAARESFSETGAGFFEIGGAGTAGVPYKQSAIFTAPTPKFSLTYDVNSTTDLYATIAKGFRLGGATTPNTNIACVPGLDQLGFVNAPTTYGSDQLWSYEAGLKTLTLGRTLSINLAGYYIDWSRIQESIVIPVCGGAFNYNVGNAVAYGGEVETRYRPHQVPGLTLGVNTGAEHATITSTINAQTAAVGENVLFVPSWSAAAILDYYHPINDRITGFVKADYDWVGPSNGSFTVSDPNYRNPSYGVLNLSAGVELTSGWHVALHAQNLFDNHIIIQRPIINSRVEAYTLHPLTIGLNVSKKF